MQSCIPTIPLFPPTPSFHCIFESIFLFQSFNVFNSVVCSGSHVYLPMYCKLEATGFVQWFSHSTFSVQPLPLCPWEFYGPLVHSVASDILIYNLIFIKNVSPLVLSHPDSVLVYMLYHLSWNKSCPFQSCSSGRYEMSHCMSYIQSRCLWFKKYHFTSPLLYKVLFYLVTVCYLERWIVACAGA